MKKTKFITLLAAVGCVAVSAGVASINLKTASADSIGGVTVNDFAMEYGASVRFNAADGKNGIRFTAGMSEDTYTKLEALESTAGVEVNYGMVIVPWDMVKKNALTKQNVFGGVYNVTDCTPNGDECTCGKTHIASMHSGEMTPSDGGRVFRGSLVDLYETNEMRDFVGLGYVEYKNGNQTAYLMADYAKEKDGTGEANVKNNTRSMTYVAQLAIEEGVEDGNQILYNTYVKKYAESGKQYAYTINHYLPTGEEGAYELAETEKLYDTLNSTVTAKNIAKSTLANKAQYASYATYGFDNEQGATSSTLYANGKTVLNCYYKAADTTLWSATDADDVALLTEVNGASEMPATMTEAGVYAKSGVSYAGEDNVYQITKYKDPNSNEYMAGSLFLNLDSTKLSAAESANWDYLTFRIAIAVEDAYYCMNYNYSAYYATQSVALYSEGISLYDNGELPLNTWIDLVIPKAYLNQTNSAILGANAPQTNDAFNASFRSKMGSTQSRFFMIENIEKPITWPGFATFPKNETTGESIEGTVPTVTYYIKDITWGVDCTAPVLQSVAKAVDGAAYNYEGVVLSDNLVARSNYLNVTKTVYEVAANGERTAVAKDALLDKTKEYVLVVEAHDGGVTDVEGNVLREEINLAFGSTALVDVANRFDLGAFADRTAQGDQTVSFVEEWKDVSGVARVETTLRGPNYGCFLYLSDTTNTLATNIINGTKYTFTVKMYIDFELNGVSSAEWNGRQTDLGIFRNSQLAGGIKAGEWVEFSFASDQLIDSGNGTPMLNNYIQETFTGIDRFFYISNMAADGNWVWPNEIDGLKVVMYLDYISWEVVS